MLPTIVLAATALLPRVDARAEAAHDLGLDDALRGRIVVGLDAETIRATSWRLDIHTDLRSYVRENRGSEGPVRISPQQVHYRVGARLRFPLDDASSWGLFTFHQSNHDVDEDDQRLNRETIAYEIYGVEWRRPGLRIAGGVYYDRGTTRALEAQTLPFDYYLFGMQLDALRALRRPLYAAGHLELIAHRNGDRTPAHLNIRGHADLGAAWRGDAADLRTFLRFERVEDYRHLGDAAHHMLLLGTAIETVSP